MGVTTAMQNNRRYRGDIATEPAWFITRGQVRLKFRLLHAGDSALLIDLFNRLSPESRRRRFHTDVARLDEETKQQAAKQLANVDNLTQGGAVIALCEEDSGEERLVGVARLARPIGKPDHPEAEAAIAVRDDFQRSGVGAELLRRLVLLAKQMKVRVMLADIEADNQPAIKLFYGLNLPTETDICHGEICLRISMPLD